jgi:hypothetical protein
MYIVHVCKVSIHASFKVPAVCLSEAPSLPSPYLGMTLVLILYLNIKCLRTGIRDGIFKL